VHRDQALRPLDRPLVGAGQERAPRHPALGVGHRGRVRYDRSTQQQADAATKAALEATGGGTANSVETDSENGATYEVEVTKPDGATVDVRLDENYDVVVIEGDGEDSGGE